MHIKRVSYNIVKLPDKKIKIPFVCNKLDLYLMYCSITITILFIIVSLTPRTIKYSYFNQAEWMLPH